MVQAYPPVQRATHIRVAPFRVVHQGAALDALRQRAPVGLALASSFCLQTVQLTVMPDQGRYTHEPHIVRRDAASNSAMSQDPGIDTMRVPVLCEFPARLLEPKVLTQGVRFPSLLDSHRGYLLQGVVEPQLADSQRRKAPVPLPAWAGERTRFDILDDEARDRE